MSFIIAALKIIFLLAFLILIHELGHFLVAKKCKVKVNEFSIGFGKQIWSKQGKETKYTIRLISLGGYCSMLGEEESVDEEGSFSNASVLKRTLIVLAGATVNIVFGLLVFFILASIVNQSMIDGLIVTKRYIVLLGQSLISLITGSTSSAELVGPVGISEMVAQTGSLFEFVYLLAVISISLGITNLLPVPGLDGGKFLILLIEAIRKKKMNQNTELIKELLQKIFSTEYQIVALTNESWSEYRNEFINNHKAKIEYKYIEEPAIIEEENNSQTEQTLDTEDLTGVDQIIQMFGKNIVKVD